MPTFSDYIARPDTDAIYVLRISGLPYLWSNAPIPSRWGGPTVVIHEGEDYTWLPTLTLGSDFAAVGTRIEPKGGVGQSGGCDFDLIAGGYQSEGLEDNTLLSVLLASTYRTDGKKIASLAADLPADESGVGTALTMIANPWSGGSAPTILYLGTETIRLASATVNSATVLTSTATRAAYGSQAQTHTGAVRDGGAVAGGAMYIADYPLTLEGRIAQLWCVPGDWYRTGRVWAFYPKGATLAAADSRIIYSGLVDGHSEDGAVVTVRTSSLDQLLKGEAVKGAPTCVLGGSAEVARQGFYIDAHNWWVHLELEISGAVAYPLIHIPDNANLTAGDTITIGATALIAGTHWGIGANVIITYINISIAINASALAANTCTASAITVAVELRPITATPELTPITFTTTNAGAITCNTQDLRPQSIMSIIDKRLRRATNADGRAPFEDVPAGRYTDVTLGTYITDTIGEQLAQPFSIRCAINCRPSEDSDNKAYITTDVWPQRQGNGARVVWYTQHGQYESFLRDLGFTEVEYEAVQAVRPGSTDDLLNRFEAYASKPPAALRIPAYPRPVPPRLYVRSMDLWSSTHWLDTGWLDDDGAAIARHMFIKNVGVLTMSSLTIDPSGFYIGGIDRAIPQLGGQNEEEIYIAQNELADKEVEAERVVALPGVSANRMMLYLLLGGSGHGTNDATYDKGWPGAGLHIPADLVDVASFEALDLARPQPRDGWVWLAKDNARKILDEECKATQQQLVADLGEIKLVAMDVPLEAAPMTRHTIGSGQLVTTEKGIAFDRQPNRIVNVVKVKAGFDPRDGKFYLEQTNRQQDSIGTWGEQQAVEVELRGISAIGDGAAKGRAIAQRIFGLYARPYALVEVDVADKAAWEWGIGDEVELTTPWVPHPSLPRRGCTDLLCRIVNKQSRLGGGSGKAFVTFTLQSYALAGQRYSLWGPSAQLLYSGTANTWTVVETTYGANVGGVYDSDYFHAADAVKLMRLGDSSAVSSTTIATKVGAPGFVDLTFATPLAGAASQRYVMWYDDATDADTTADQLKYVYMSGFNGSITLASGTAQAFRYR